ncbi:Putative ribosome-binding factor A, mitochondrial [Anthophora quadrimaculata]
MYFLIRVQNTQTFSLKEMSRYIFTSRIEYSISRQSKFMNKLINRDQSKRDPLEFVTNPKGASKETLSLHTLRRMNVLNKVFMEYITDMMSTGEIDPEILNKNIEISHIKITPDFKTINVHWIDNNLQNSNTEELLKECAFKLRHELSQLRIIGNVPLIQFVKCKSFHKLKEVKLKLQSLDLREDSVSNLFPDAMYHTVHANRIDHDEEVENEKSLNNSKDTFSITVPVMQHNVFGLDHHRIMSKIKVSLNKAKNPCKRQINVQLRSFSPSEQNIENISNFLTDKEQKEQFDKFLKQNRKEQRQKRKLQFSETDSVIHDNEQQEDEVDNYDFDVEIDDNDFTDDNYENFGEFIDKEFRKPY